MPLLISILDNSAGGQFISDSGGVFVSDAGGVFEDSEGILRISTENFAGNRYWSGDVIGIDPVAWRMDNLHGGACRLSGAGSISVTLAALASVGWWVQTMSYQCRIEYTDTLEDAAILLFNCTLHLKSVDIPLSATFDVFPETYDTQLLSTATNYDGETVVLPKAFGTVNYVKPVRLADSSTLIDGWTQKPDFNGVARYSAVAQSVGSKIYLGLGENDTDYLKDWWVHDTAAQTYIWTQKRDSEGGVRSGAVSATVGTNIYVGLGYNIVGRTKDWWKYDTLTDEWTALTDFGGTARYAAVAAAVGTNIYVGLGWSTAAEKDWWKYNTLTDAWTQMTDFGDTARSGSVAVAVGTKIYTGIVQAKDDWWAYDTALDTWTEKAAFPADGAGLPTGRRDFVGAAVGAAIYLGTGSNGAFFKDWWMYETTTDTWTQRNDFGGGIRAWAVAVAVDTDIYLGTGKFNNLMKDWWVHGATEAQHRYSAGGLTSLTVYDDGVDVSSNASAIANNAFTYSVRPVGELTISGTSPYVHSDDIFQYLCGSSFLNLGLNMAFAGTNAIDYWATEQINVIDFLSKIAAAKTIYFFIQSGVLNVRSFAAGYSPAVTVDVADDALDGTSYFHSQPVKVYRTKWKQRTAVEESIGKYVKEIDQEETVTTAYPYGSETETTIETFTETRSIAATRLAAIAARYLLTQTSLSLPLQNLSTKPGDELVLSDDRYTGHEIVAKSGIIRDIVFDIINKKWTIEADGSFFS